VKAALVISVRDNVATALRTLEAGEHVALNGTDIDVSARVPAGHKIAIRLILRGEPVLKYGSEIGIATADIQPGEHVHTHNVASTRGRGDLAAASAQSRPFDAAQGRRLDAGRLAEPEDDTTNPNENGEEPPKRADVAASKS